jgi:hypothetical protein
MDLPFLLVWGTSVTNCTLIGSSLIFVLLISPLPRSGDQRKILIQPSLDLSQQLAVSRVAILLSIPQRSCLGSISFRPASLGPITHKSGLGSTWGQQQSRPLDFKANGDKYKRANILQLEPTIAAGTGIRSFIFFFCSSKGSFGPLLTHCKKIKMSNLNS